MRSLATWVLLLCLLGTTFTAGAIHSVKPATESAYTTLTVGKIADMNAREFGEYSGQKLTFKERVAYNIVKAKLKKQLKKGTLTEEASFDMAAASGSFNFGAFLLGLLLGLIGLIIVLIAFDDKDAWKEALIGTGVALLIFGTVLLL